MVRVWIWQLHNKNSQVFDSWVLTRCTEEHLCQSNPLKDTTWAKKKKIQIFFFTVILIMHSCLASWKWRFLPGSRTCYTWLLATVFIRHPYFDPIVCGNAIPHDRWEVGEWENLHVSHPSVETVCFSSRVASRQSAAASPTACHRPEQGRHPYHTAAQNAFTFLIMLCRGAVSPRCRGVWCSDVVRSRKKKKAAGLGCSRKVMMPQIFFLSLSLSLHFRVVTLLLAFYPPFWGAHHTLNSNMCCCSALISSYKLYVNTVCHRSVLLGAASRVGLVV